MSRCCFSKELVEWERLVGNLEFGDATPLLATPRSVEKFIKNHPDLRGKFAAILRDLEIDPFQPHLKYHPLKGSFKGVQAVSITYSYRLTLTILVFDKEIILLDVGSHDEVYR